jgi:hypothetical protein
VMRDGNRPSDATHFRCKRAHQDARAMTKSAHQSPSVNKTEGRKTQARRRGAEHKSRTRSAGGAAAPMVLTGQFLIPTGDHPEGEESDVNEPLWSETVDTGECVPRRVDPVAFRRNLGCALEPARSAMRWKLLWLNLVLEIDGAHHAQE